MLQLVDTHCHLDFDAYDNDRNEVINRAEEIGVIKIINPGVSLESSKAAVQLAQKFTSVCAAIGIHPNNTTVSPDYILKLKELSYHTKVVAIGEIGLDYYRDVHPRKEQRKLLLNQLELAKEIKRPVIIHDRQSTDDIMDILLDWCAELLISNLDIANTPGVLHSFSSDLTRALQAIELNFFIGITGTVTYKNAKDLNHIVAEIPLNHLLIETDAPFLTPHPHRGERNEPSNVFYIAEKIAQIQEISTEEVAKVTFNNAEKIFCLRE